MTSSRLPGFYKRTLAERLDIVQNATGLSDTERRILSENNEFDSGHADRMVENAVGVFPLPLGIAANFRINGNDLLVPLAVEEPSVVAAASNAANLLRGGLGIETSATPPVMIGQIQVLDFSDIRQACANLEDAAEELISLANGTNPSLLARGGGARTLRVRSFSDTAVGPMIVVHLEVDVRDAMGANMVNSMVEAIASDVARIASGRVRLRILSNLADKRLVTAQATAPIATMSRGGWSGEEVARGIVEASVMADIDPYRAATHNKGAMNGVDAFLVATGQDWRAVEAGCHAYAARHGQYSSLSHWRIDGDNIQGTLEIPMQVGVVGGVTKSHPVVQVVHKMLGFPSAQKLGEIAAACGLAQNLAALMALATDGIQRGHMRMHARNIATEAGATQSEIDAVVHEMRRVGKFDMRAAKSALEKVRS